MKNFETTRSWHFPGRNSLKLSYCSEDKLFKLHFLNKCILDGVFVLFCFKKTFRPKKEKKKRLLTYKHSSSRCAVYTVAVLHISKWFCLQQCPCRYKQAMGGLIQVLQQWDWFFLWTAGRYLRGWWKKQQWQSMAIKIQDYLQLYTQYR